VKTLPALLFVSAASLLTAAPPVISDAPVKNFVLKVFTKEGPLSLSVRGSEARYLGPDLIEVTDMNITTFTTEPAMPTRPETSLLSPEAYFLPNSNKAHGDKSVRIIRDDLEAWGTKWTYDQKEKRISLDQKVRVVFHAELKDILQ
jgi:hypothetical protein